MDFKIEDVYLGIGSNLGERKENINKALEYISQRMRIEKKSSIYDTEPVGNVNQARFLNMVIYVKTSIPANTLLFLLKGIESKMGRLPGPPNGPRIIDIDILLYGNQVIDTPDLKVPHPRMLERAFVIVPLAEIAPDLVHPVQKKTIQEIRETLRTNNGLQGVLPFKES